MIFHSSKVSKVLEELNAREEGLTSSEAADRLAKYGPNKLDEAKKKSIWAKFFAQFKDTMILVLLAAAAVSAGINIFQHNYHELFESGLILLIVIINAVIGTIQENKAENALEALKNLNKPFSKVIRDGELTQIKSEDLVVGDIVQLEAGDIVPADLRLISSASLKIEEAALTGESVPSEKHFDKVVKETAPLGDRDNMAYSSGVVAYGRGQGIVVATGMHTEVGKIAQMLETSDTNTTPLQKQLAKTAKILSIGVLAIAVVIFVASLLRSIPILDAFMTSVAIAVAAIPEGLPAIVTIVLAMGVRKMSKRNAIVRNLPAVETLGSCEIICSDKTGTLTLNRMTVKQLYTTATGIAAAEGKITDSDTDTLVRAMSLCNDSVETASGRLGGDPTETALVQYLMDCGLDFKVLKDRWPRVDEVPFDSKRKLMTTVNENDGEKIAHIKGAPDILLGRCDKILDNGTVRAITGEDIEHINGANHYMATKALRVLGVALKTDSLDNKDTIEYGLTFVGLVGMIDPARPEVRDAVRVCRKAGMKPIMITGDHKDTAAAIASEVGILKKGDKVMLGAEIDELSDEDFAKVLPEVSVFARVSPENKVRIVQTFKKMGKIVAMTGDGVNDAPSIKEADIGIGMGITGTDVSKNASDMVLADDNFATIIGAVEEGRKIYINIKKAIQFLLSANIAEVLCLFIATVFLNVEFLTPVMILWINLVTDSLPALSLGMEEAESDVMNYPPRKTGASLFAGKTGMDIIIQGIMQTALVMTSFAIGNYVLADGVNNHAVAMTMAFVSLCLIQLFHSYNLRSQCNSVVGKNLFHNKWLNYSFLIGVALTVFVVIVPPVRSVFNTAALNWYEWLISIGVGIVIIPFVEIQKAIERAIAKKKSSSICGRV